MLKADIQAFNNILEQQRLSCYATLTFPGQYYQHKVRVYCSTKCINYPWTFYYQSKSDAKPGSAAPGFSASQYSCSVIWQHRLRYCSTDWRPFPPHRTAPSTGTAADAERRKRTPNITHKNSVSHHPCSRNQQTHTLSAHRIHQHTSCKCTHRAQFMPLTRSVIWERIKVS